MFVADAGFVFAVGHVEAPVAGIFNAPVAAQGASEAFHADRQTADVIEVVPAIVEKLAAR